VVRALLGAADPVVIIGTLWPDRYAAYTSVPAPGGPDSQARKRQVVELADVVRIDEAFSAAEQGRARDAASRDPRLKAALVSDGYGLTQTLAAAPQLVTRWEDARATGPYGAYAWAVLTAALDAARLGAHAPLSEEFLRAAAPGYCTSRQQAEAPANWFEQALAYTVGTLHGAASALAPAAADMCRIAGYTPADYLIQYASGKRRYERLPASTWDAALAYITDTADTTRLAGSAENRLLYRYAIPLYRRAADASDYRSAWLMARLLQKEGDLDEISLSWRALDAHEGLAAAQVTGRHDMGRRYALAVASEEHARQFAERGDLDGLRHLADGGDWIAAAKLADELAERGDMDGLRHQADAGNSAAAAKLADQLAERGDMDGLRARVDTGDSIAAVRLADQLAERGDLDGLRRLTDAGEGYASRTLAELLVTKLTAEGRHEEAERLRRFGLDPDGSIAQRRSCLILEVAGGCLEGPEQSGNRVWRIQGKLS
jgi:hypothetical protein